jgi:soluble lytic murein transglycosylase
MPRLAVIALLLISGLASGAGAQTLQSKANEIRARMDARDFGGAERLVRELRASDPDAFARNNYDYLLARLSERGGRNAEASALYTGVLNRGSSLAEYALWRLSSLARSAGDLSSERQYLSRLIASFPSSALNSRARDRMIDSLTESNDHRAAISLLRPTAQPSGARGRSRLAQLGEAYRKAGDEGAARAAFNQLVAGSRDDYALEAATGLDAIDRAAGARPSEFDALRRARIYLFNRHWPEARVHLSDIIERFPASPNRPEALYQMGYAFYREDKYDEAIGLFNRAHAEFPTKSEGEQGYYWVATALQKARRYEEAARRYMDFLTAYPESNLVEGAYRNVVDTLRYSGKDAEAIEWSRRIQTVYQGKPLEAVGLFNEAKIELARGRFDAALQLFTRLQAYPIHARLVSAPIRGEAAFMRAFTIEQMGRIAEAARLYLAMPENRDNYFGYRATGRLQAMAATQAGRRVIEALERGYKDQARAALRAGRYSEAKDAATQALRLSAGGADEREMIDVLRASYSQLRAYNISSRYRLIDAARPAITAAQAGAANRSHAALAAELLFLGLYDEGAPELRLSGWRGARATNGIEEDGGEVAGSTELIQVSNAASNSDVTYSLAVYSNRGDQSWHAIQFAEPLARGIPQDYRIELMPRDLAEMLYPAPYKDALIRYGDRMSVDPRLVLALARQESRFNPSVKSHAAARGLVQFIHETATRLAAEEELENFKLDDVYDPEIAVRLATRYVADLLKLFPDNPYAVAASYNTGEANVERWIFRSRSNDVDRMFAEIAIPETKDYVAKVMSNYRAYQQLYTPDLKRRW